MPTQVNLGRVVGPTGPTGPTGPAPVRGTDYWTEEDQESIIGQAAQAAAGLVSGNVPKKTVTDLVAHGEDAYAQKPIEVRVKGKTWVNRCPEFNARESGLVFSTDETGLITVSGTATEDTFITVPVDGIAPSKQYVLAVSSRPKGVSRIYFQATSDGEYIGICNINVNDASGTSVTGSTPSSYDSVSMVIYVASGATVNASFRVMLVDGTEAPDCFTPPASIASVQTGNLVTSGKNLVNLDGAEYVKSSSSSSSSATFGDDGSVTITGATDSWNGCYIELKSVVLPPGSYVASRFTNGSMWLLLSSPNVLNPLTSGDYYTDAGYPFRVGMSAGQSVAFKIDAPSRVAFSIGDQIAEGVSLTLYPQLELGSTATAYEPPNVTQTPLPEVELRSLPNGTCDELVIKADGTCEVERNTVQVVFDGSEDENWEEATTYPGVFQLKVNGADYQNINIVSDRYSTATGFSSIGDKQCAVSSGSLQFGVKDSAYENAAAFKASLATNPLTVTFGAVVTTEPQSTVALPALPAPIFNQYHDSDVPSDTSTEYARDINIVLANLEAVQTALLGGE